MALALYILVLVALLCYKAVAVVRTRRRHAREAALRGCQPPPDAPRKGFLGIGTLKESLRATHEDRGPIWMHETLNAIGKNVHTVRAAILDYELFITRDPENVKAMFATQSQDFDIGPHREKCFKSLLGDGVMTNRQEKWKHSRSLIRPQFARDNVADLDLFQRHLDALLRRLPVSGDGWTAKVDLSPLFFNFTLDTSTEFLFGQAVHAQSPEARLDSDLPLGLDMPDLSSFGHHLDEAKHIIDRRGAMAKYGWLLRDKAFPEHCNAVQKCVDYFVKAKLARTSDCEKGNETPSGIGKTKFILLDELAKETRDPLELRSELLNVLHASRDTTASLLGWCFYFLARHPDALATLREEIVTYLGSDPAGEITFSALWTCRYLQHVVNETIRMVGIVPMNERAAIHDTTLPRGGGPDGESPVFVPEGTQVLVPTYSMQHREDIWGPDVEQFKPERWHDRKFGWDFIPFGGGARQCIGQQFARTEAMYTISRMLQIFDKVENLEGLGPIKMHHTIENRSGSGVQVRLHLSSPLFSKYLQPGPAAP
ncbi:Cytochrome P450 monooxygenase [Exophiala dermatitidis]